MKNTKEIVEGKATVLVDVKDKVSKELDVFYNPQMEVNRSITIALLKALHLKEKKQLFIIDPLAGTGIRTVRLLKEVPELIRHITANDISPEATKLIHENLKRNNCDQNKVTVMQKGATTAILETGIFDYIDIDPFGSPAPFLHAAIERIKHQGILAITATDTGALCGTFVKACRRRYHAESQRYPQMHELAARILIKYVQEIGAIFEKALTPIYATMHDHYIRVFFEASDGAKKCDSLLKQHKYITESEEGELIESSHNNFKHFAGPLYTGAIYKKKLAQDITKFYDTKVTQTIAKEAEVQEQKIGTYSIHQLAKSLKLAQVPKTKEIKKALEMNGHKCEEAHFKNNMIRTNAPFEVIKNAMKKER